LGKTSGACVDNRCHPGGFSYCLLRQNWTAIGQGIALPEEKGGIPCLLDPPYVARIQIHSHDVTHFDLSPMDKKPLFRYDTIPFDTKFDHVILDAHRFDTGNETVVPWEPERMVLSQLIIAFEYTVTDGTVVIRLGNIERDKTIATLYLLSLVFKTVKVLKPRSSHTHRGSFYAVASGFQNNVESPCRLLSMIHILRTRWWEATFGGEEGNGTNPVEWWRGIFSTESLPELFGEKLIQLAIPVWDIQITGLKSYFRKNGIKF